MNMVNEPSLQFLEQSYMPVMGVTTRLLLNMRRGRCATGSTRRGGRYESKNGTWAAGRFSATPQRWPALTQSSYDRLWPIWLYHGEDSGSPATGGGSLQRDDAASSQRQCSPAYGGDCIRSVECYWIGESGHACRR